MENCFFNCTVAKQTSIPAAIMFQNIAFWVETNRANERNYHDGKYWTKNSKRAFCSLFDFMSYAQIKGALSKLLEAGLIEAEHIRDAAKMLDRSMSYTLTEKGWQMYSSRTVKNSQSIGEKQPMSLAENSQCISDKKPMFNMNTYINTNINSEDIKEINKEKDEPPIGGEHKKGRTNTVDEEIHTLILEKANGDETVEKLLLDWIANRKAKRAVHTVRAIQLNLEKLEEMAKQSNLSIPEYLGEVVRMGWQAFFPVRQSQNNISGIPGTVTRSGMHRYGEFTKRGENDDNYIKRGSGIGGESDRTTGFVPSTGFRRGNEEIPDAGTGEGA